MKRAQRIKELCEKMWNEKDAQVRCNKARWRLVRSQLVLYVGERYQSDTDIICTEGS